MDVFSEYFYYKTLVEPVSMFLVHKIQNSVHKRIAVFSKQPYL